MSRRSTVFAAFLVLTAIPWGRTAQSADDGKAGTAGTFHVVGYLPEYRMSSLDPGVGRFLTDLVYFSVEPEASGALNLRRLRPESLQALRKIKDEHHVALLLCVGGWERSGEFARLAARPESRARFVEAVVRFCQEHRFDGVDLDWEHPKDEAEQRNYASLLVALKQGLAPRGLQLTIAIAGWQTLPAEAFAAVDRVHLMSYDAKGRHSTYEMGTSEVSRLIKNGVPASKICLGVPFYGRGVKDGGRTLTYDEIVRRHQPAAAVDEVDGIYFNGIATIERKTRYARANHLGGIMVWELGQDTRDEHSLLRAIDRSVRDTRQGKKDKE